MKNSLFLLLTLSTLVSCGTKEEGKPVVQDIKELVFASGELEWDNSYNLTAQTDGILVNATFDVGNKVTENQIIASIDNKTNENNTASAKDLVVISKENLTDNAPALQQLQQNIKFAESKYQQDKTQAERYKRLYDSQSIAKVEYENMQLAAENSLSQLNALKKQYQQVLQQSKQNYINTENQLKNNQVVLGYNKLVVPQKGTIIKKLKFSGDYVKKGDVIAVIADENKVEGVLNVDENSIGKVKIGQTVFVQLNTNKNEVYNAKISEILAAFDEQTQSFICKVIFDKPLNTSLYGTQLEANILVGEKKNALLIPRNFLGFGNKVMVKGKDEAVIVKTGIVSTEYVEILDGITKEDVLLPLKP
ncbi:efflux RND transporter periplasmic adaptor subunit [Flavobacterium proteolyticum]|uniref:HlyD family efflux transporter periplasmic adaptor subunit n=1 Tax=Flavobacterium proteolyticum TaxID=2911683 RepID=A0ABR9WPG6_9FLAO|nr:HlyD family efflux transporter periplasmic adaptor subunit [Flavobacterium proteolyticum]MBE9575794.1 HlyD family efflux transporter periplasmic adaptor subunit [Flavobacterium proteolyticum]